MESHLAGMCMILFKVLLLCGSLCRILCFAAQSIVFGGSLCRILCFAAQSIVFGGSLCKCGVFRVQSFVYLQRFCCRMRAAHFINILLGGAIRLRLYPLNLMRLVPPEGKRGRRPTSLVY